MAQIADMAGAMGKGVAAGESAARTGKVGDERKLVGAQTAAATAQAGAATASAANQTAEALLKGLQVPKAQAQHDLYMTPQGADLMYGIEGNSAYGLPGRIRALGEDVGTSFGETMKKTIKRGPDPKRMETGKKIGQGIRNLWKTFNVR